jgi:regulator of extracellular matrix RemA (YlzA/DUF370 family)
MKSHEMKIVCRSILMHPIGIPMVTYLNENAVIPEQPDYVRKALNDFKGDKLDGVFAEAALSWRNGSRKELIAQLLKKFGKQQNKESLKRPEKDKVRVRGFDLLFHDTNSNDYKESAVAIVNLGCRQHGYWWARQIQILTNVSRLRRNVDIKYKFDQPILLSSITIDKSKCNSSEFKKETPIDKIHFDARFGVFLCVWEGGEFRISLLWRANTTNLDEASRHFGKVLNAVQLCLHLRNYCKTHKYTINYESLGPNCCRFGDTVSDYMYECFRLYFADSFLIFHFTAAFRKLYRSYDTRLQPSERRANLYLEPNVFSNVCAPIAKSVLKIDDHLYNVPLEEKVSHSEWLWQFRAQLLVISTTYHYGVHYAEHPLHLLPIIKQLESLHRQGFVHGDIRGQNMVLSFDKTEGSHAIEDNKDKGWLIDFDYGGKLNSVTYPEGYSQVLLDGRRPGTPGQRISIEDDWRSLFGLILHVYTFPLKEGDDGALVDGYEKKLGKLRETIEIYHKNDSKANAFEKSDFESPATLLREYLELVSKRYTIRLPPHIQLGLLFFEHPHLLLWGKR